MAKAGDTSLSALRSHIIARPRLTKLLEQTRARILILVAPAGFGKTTVALQWLRPKRHVWYQGTAASRDVASLAVGLAESVAGRGSAEAQRVRSRCAVGTEDPADIDALAGILASAISKPAADVTIAIDDYDAIAASPAAESLIWTLATLSDARFLVAGRARPRWATARRLLYGEIFELGQQVLAMDPSEADEVLAKRPGRTLPGLAALAQGWPAVLGLAALTGDVPPSDGLPDDLYDFFAEELFQQTPHKLREPLMKLAFIESIDPHAIDLLLGGDATAVVEVAERIGFLSASPSGTYTSHPLVRAFLEKKALLEGRFDSSIGADIATTFLNDARWDDAFSAIERFRLPPILDDLITAALPEMVRTGRLATLERWACFGKANGKSAAVDVVTAEIALRRSAYQAAETIAARAARRLAEGHPLRARAYMIAGNAAHLVDAEERGFDHHTHARNDAITEEQRREAIWGQLICANQLDLAVVEELVRELEQRPAGAPEDGLRLATMRGVIDLRGPGIVAAIPILDAAHSLVAEADDPLARTSFLNVYARCLALGGFYAEGSAIAQHLIDDARDNRLDFVVPHALVAKALSEAGANRPSAALRLLDEAEGLARSMRDSHNQVDAQSLRSRIAVSLRRSGAALDATSQAPTGAGPVARSEFLLSRALALVAAGRIEDGLRLQKSALGDSGRSRKAHEVRNLARWIPVVATAEKGASAGVVRALRRSAETGVVDGFVVAYRGFPTILGAVANDEAALQLAVPILERVGDQQRARKAGLISDVPTAGGLSNREAEVYELLAAGRTNREIAQALFISEVTVKVHVRHILRKLGARTRTEAVAQGATPLQREQTHAP